MRTGDHCKFHNRESHHVQDCIELCQMALKLLTMIVLRIEAKWGSNDVKMMESQDK